MQSSRQGAEVPRVTVARHQCTIIVRVPPPPLCILCIVGPRLSRPCILCYRVHRLVPREESHLVPRRLLFSCIWCAARLVGARLSLTHSNMLYHNAVLDHPSMHDLHCAALRYLVRRPSGCFYKSGKLASYYQNFYNHSAQYENAHEQRLFWNNDGIPLKTAEEAAAADAAADVKIKSEGKKKHPYAPPRSAAPFRATTKRPQFSKNQPDTLIGRANASRRRLSKKALARSCAQCSYEVHRIDDAATLLSTAGT